MCVVNYLLFAILNIIICMSICSRTNRFLQICKVIQKSMESSVKCTMIDFSLIYGIQILIRKIFQKIYRKYIDYYYEFVNKSASMQITL